MRPFWIGPVTIPLAMLVAACAQSPAPVPGLSPTSLSRPSATGVNPANIKRIGGQLPPGYEVTSGIPSVASPRVIWGLKGEVTAKPQQCAAFTDPGNGRDQAAQGVSGSGSGGIVDAVVVTLPAAPGPLEWQAPDHTVLAGCGQWSMTALRAEANIRLTDPPHIDGTETIGMVADIRTSVESGTEIDSRAYTFIAYLGDYYAFTTVTTDPGSALPALTPQFAADLLVKTVSALRG